MGQGFDPFWSEFRKALLAGDEAKLRRLSAPVVRSHGELDDDPKLEVAAAGIKASLDRLVADPGEAEPGRSMRDLLNSDDPGAPVPEEPATYRRVGPLVFEEGAGGWRLTEIYRGPDG